MPVGILEPVRGPVADVAVDPPPAEAGLGAGPRSELQANMSDNPPLEVAVSSLSYPAEGRDEFLLMNVNRWRDQMSLPHLSADKLHAGGDLDDETQLLPLDDGTKVTLINFKGEFDSGGMTPPFAGGQAMANPPVASEAPAADSPLRFETPAGWNIDLPGLPSAVSSVPAPAAPQTPCMAAVSA